MIQPDHCPSEKRAGSENAPDTQGEHSNSDEKYRVLFERSKDAILIIENGVFSDCNPAAVDMLGCETKQQLINMPPFQLSPRYQPDGRESFQKAAEMMDIALKNGSHRFEWVHVRADGQPLSVEVVLTTISSEKGNEIIHTIWRDISRHKEVENAKAHEQEKLRSILESIPHGIALVDGQGQYQYVNPHFTQITGYTIDDIPNKEAWFGKAYPDPAYRKQVTDTWKTDSTHSGLGKFREFEVCCKNGDKKHIEFRSTFLADLKISVLTDVTDRKKSEEMIREKDRLQGVLELSGAVCHEMNQPLMSIQGYFDLLTMDIAPDSPMHKSISKIQTQIERLTKITKKLMVISRYETKEYLKEKIVDIDKSSNKADDT